jgi:hypothetical protein
MRVLHDALACALIAGSIGAVGCDGEARAPSRPEPATGLAAAPQAPAAYEVHEWGFIGYHAGPTGAEAQLMVAGPGHFPAWGGETLGLGTIGHGGGGGYGSGGKPVLYVHLAPGTDSLTFSATVALPPGAGTRRSYFAEHFPPASRSDEGGGSQLRWEGVRATRNGAVGAQYPTGDSMACRIAPDGYCEAAELARYETTDAAALQINRVTYTHLFYRADIGTALPLHVTLDGDRVTAQNTGPEAIPGRMLRIVREGTSASTRVLILDPPAPAASLEVAAPVETGPDGALAWLREGLRNLGMTQPEIEVFLIAWREMLLGADEATAAAGPIVQVGVPPPGLRPKCDSLVYFLPQAAVDRAVPLAFDPPPRAVRRAILAQVELATPVGHGSGAVEGVGEARFRGGEGVRARIGEMSLRGSLSREVVRRVTQRHINEVRFCYEQGLQRSGSLRGRVAIAFVIAPTGAVQSAAVHSTTLGDPTVEQCISQAVRRWTFPAPEGGGIVSINLAFLLEPAL